MSDTSKETIKVSGGILLIRSKSGTSRVQRVLVHAKRGSGKNQVKCRLRKYTKRKMTSKIPVLVKCRDKRSVSRIPVFVRNYKRKLRQSRGRHPYCRNKDSGVGSVSQTNASDSLSLPSQNQKQCQNYIHLKPGCSTQQTVADYLQQFMLDPTRSEDNSLETPTNFKTCRKLSVSTNETLWCNRRYPIDDESDSSAPDSYQISSFTQETSSELLVYEESIMQSHQISLQTPKFPLFNNISTLLMQKGDPFYFTPSNTIIMSQYEGVVSTRESSQSEIVSSDDSDEERKKYIDSGLRRLRADESKLYLNITVYDSPRIESKSEEYVIPPLLQRLSSSIFKHRGKRKKAPKESIPEKKNSEKKETKEEEFSLSLSNEEDSESETVSADVVKKLEELEDVKYTIETKDSLVLLEEEEKDSSISTELVVEEPRDTDTLEETTDEDSTLIPDEADEQPEPETTLYVDTEEFPTAREESPEPPRSLYAYSDEPLKSISVENIRDSTEEPRITKPNKDFCVHTKEPSNIILINSESLYEYSDETLKSTSVEDICDCTEEPRLTKQNKDFCIHTKEPSNITLMDSEDSRTKSMESIEPPSIAVEDLSKISEVGQKHLKKSKIPRPDPKKLKQMSEQELTFTIKLKREDEAKYPRIVIEPVTKTIEDIDASSYLKETKRAPIEEMSETSFAIKSCPKLSQPKVDKPKTKKIRSIFKLFKRDDFCVHIADPPGNDSCSTETSKLSVASILTEVHQQDPVKTTVKPVEASKPVDFLRKSISKLFGMESVPEGPTQVVKTRTRSVFNSPPRSNSTSTTSHCSLDRSLILRSNKERRRLRSATFRDSNESMNTSSSSPRSTSTRSLTSYSSQASGILLKSNKLQRGTKGNTITRTYLEPKQTGLSAQPISKKKEDYG